MKRILKKIGRSIIRGLNKNMIKTIFEDWENQHFLRGNCRGDLDYISEKQRKNIKQFLASSLEKILLSCEVEEKKPRKILGMLSELTGGEEMCEEEMCGYNTCANKSNNHIKSLIQEITTLKD